MMKALCLLIGLWLFAACMKQVPNSAEGLTAIAPHIVWQKAGVASIPGGVEFVRITVTSAGLDGPRSKTFSFRTHEGVVDGLPVGISALVRVEGLDSLNRALFRGETYVANLTKVMVTVDIVADEITPIPPSEISVTSISATRLLVSWRDNSFNEDFFIVLRMRDSSGVWDTAAKVSGNSFLDTALTPGTGYSYRVFSMNNAGYSLFPDSGSAITNLPGKNNPPAFETQDYDLPDTVSADTGITDTLKALDGDPGAKLVFHILTPLPGLVLDSLTGAFHWQPKAPGQYVIVFEVQDDSLAKAALSWTVWVEEKGPFIGFDLPLAKAKVGEQLTLSLIAKNVTDVFGVSCKIVFNPVMLSITEDDINAADFLGNDVLQLIEVDNDTISIGITRTAPQAGVSGSGAVAKLVFKMKAMGTDTLKLESSGFHVINSSGNDVGYIGSVKKGVAVMSVK